MSKVETYETSLFDAVWLKLTFAVTAMEMLSNLITDSDHGNKVSSATFTLKAVEKDIMEMINFAKQNCGDIVLIGDYKNDNFKEARFEPKA
jgi:hypothetical protein